MKTVSRCNSLLFVDKIYRFPLELLMKMRSLLAKQQVANQDALFTSHVVLDPHILQNSYSYEILQI